MWSLILKLTTNFRVSKEGSDSLFSQTIGRRKEPQHGCNISICKINHKNGIFKKIMEKKPFQYLDSSTYCLI